LEAKCEVGMLVGDICSADEGALPDALPVDARFRTWAAKHLDPLERRGLVREGGRSPVCKLCWLLLTSKPAYEHGIVTASIAYNRIPSP